MLHLWDSTYNFMSFNIILFDPFLILEKNIAIQPPDQYPNIVTEWIQGDKPLKAL